SLPCKMRLHRPAEMLRPAVVDDPCGIESHRLDGGSPRSPPFFPSLQNTEKRQRQPSGGDAGSPFFSRLAHRPTARKRAASVGSLFECFVLWFPNSVWEPLSRNSVSWSRYSVRARNGVSREWVSQTEFGNQGRSDMA